MHATTLGTWVIADHRIELSQTGSLITASIYNTTGQMLPIDSQNIYCGINGRTTHMVLIQRIGKLAQELISVFSYPREKPSEVWIFEAGPQVGLEVSKAKIWLKKDTHESLEKALKHLETALKIQTMQKGTTQELDDAVHHLKGKLLWLKWKQAAENYLPNPDEKEKFYEALDTYQDQNDLLTCLETLVMIEINFSSYHHLMSALVHEEKSEYIPAMEAYLALSEDNPNDLACFDRAYSCLEKASDEDASLKDRIDSVRIMFEKQLRSLETTSKPPTCFICFNVEEKDVGRWLEETLVPDLDCAGIKPIFCLPELSHGQDLDNFHELARQSDKVIVVCTSTLKTKFEERKKASTGVAQEISMIRRRYRDPNKTDTIFPIFPKGMRDSIPTAYFESIFGTKFSPFKEGSFEMNYFSNAFDLICALKGISRKKSRKVRKRFQNEVKTILRGEINQEEVQAWRASKETKLQALRASIIQRISDYTQVVNLPPLPAHFVGREEELATLHAACQQKSRVAIAGLGGVGKTALALKYADQFKLDYQFVHFMLASTEQLAIEGLLRLADDLHLPKSDKPEERLSWLKVTLERLKKDYLLIFDGMDQKETFDAIEQYLPDNGRCLLLTTRMPQDAQLVGFELIELHPLTLEDAVQYLLATTHSQDHSAAKTLAQKLGRLPLALTHAARYIDSKKISIHKYIEHFDKYTLNLFEKERLKLKPHEQTILTTWQISIDAIREKENGSRALEILDLFAFLGQAPIPHSLVEEWCRTSHPEISDLDLEDALSHLLEYSMIGSSQPDTYKIHPLVQHVTKYLTLQERQHAVFRQAVDSLLAVLIWFDREDATTWMQPRPCLPHAMALVETLLMSSIPLDKQGQLFSKIGEIHNVFGKMHQALVFYQKALKIELELYGENHPDVVASYNNIGMVYQDLGNNDTALEFLQKALAIRLQLYGENHPHVASSYNNIGMVHQSLGENAQALEFHQKALKIWLQIYGENHPDVARSYNNIGMVYQSLGENAKALEFFLNALKIWLRVYGENHPHVALSYNNIGMVYQNLGENVQALKFLHKPLKIQLQVYGENHPDVARSYNNIGMVYQSLGENAKALEFFLNALKIWLWVYGENHPHVALSYNNIGMVYQNLGENVQALEFFQKALRIQLQVYVKNHPHVALSYNNIGGVYQSLGENTQALEFFQKALRIQLQVYVKNHPDVARSYNNIGVTYQNLGEYAQALEFFQKALKANFALTPIHW